MREFRLTKNDLIKEKEKTITEFEIIELVNFHIFKIEYQHNRDSPIFVYGLV